VSWKLITRCGARKGTKIPISPTPYWIGRDPGCQLRPASQAVSERHCALLVRSSDLFIQEGDGEAFVNGLPLAGTLQLSGGDLIQIGPLVFAVAPVQKKAFVNQPERSKDDVIADMLLGLNVDEADL